ncbi:MAG: potassium transporter Kup [Hydrogenophaga sp.]
MAGLTLGALGVVYGDIGTSPLYALKEVFHGGHVATTPDNILGVLSLLFWTMTVIVSIKYVLLILRADNNGEGGLIAMLALATNAVNDKPQLRRTLMLVGLFGTAIFYGDAVITPAMTVLGAMEGIEVYKPEYHDAVLPMALVVLAGLFAVQRFGTGGIGKAFGPVMLLWFTSLMLLGLPQIIDNPRVLAAINPLYALNFCLEYRWVAFVALGAVVLVVTGGEALYADLGHFGKKPIRLAWYGIVMPALVINYFGQGAMLLGNPAGIKNPFFLLAPDWAEIPLFLLATAAAAVASQALITAAFSVTKQAIQLGILPRLRIVHTSVRDIGQIYVPFVNWALFALVGVAVVFFGSSGKLAGAYGVAVTIDMTITTVMTFFVIRYGWKYPLALCVAATGIFFVIDVTFLASNLLKVPAGGWFPLLIGVCMFTLMQTWKQGRKLLSDKLRQDAIELPVFLEAVFINPPTRVAGTAVFLSSEKGSTPNALLHNLKHNQVLHEQVIVLRVLPCDTPRVDARLRIEAESLMTGIWVVTARHGFMERPDVPEFIRILAYQKTLAIDSMKTSYFVSRASVGEENLPGLSPIRRALFGWLQRNAGRASDYFELPDNRLVEMGQRT